MQVTPKCACRHAVFFAMAVAIVAAGGEAAAQNSLGLGNPEAAIKPTGVFGPLLLWIKTQQSWFYELMRAELKSMRAGGPGALALAGLSFAYGVFHAAGPGHGKAVISAYMIANEVEARRGIALSFASAFAQALSAIAMVAALTLLLRGMGLRQQDMTGWLETASYGAIMVLGAWLLWSKLSGRGHAHAAHGGHGHAANCDGGRDHDHGHGHDHHGHGHAHGEHGGHLHAPDPAKLGRGGGLREAWTAIVAVGLRPCSGALIVLTFAFLNGLYLAGIGAVAAMAVGTGLTVAALAALAVWAKGAAVRVAEAAGWSGGLFAAAEIAGAAAVFLIGLGLFAASVTT
jgi:ABC-type nickel/cobalt efflux system permease component RcnA